MYCPSCGKDMPHDARFCPACGRPSAAAHTPYAAAPAGNFDGLVRPREGRKIGGVCAAFANRYGWDLTLTRLATLLLALFTGAGFIAYAVLWVMLPEAPYLLPAVTTPPSSYGGNTAA